MTWTASGSSSERSSPATEQLGSRFLIGKPLQPRLRPSHIWSIPTTPRNCCCARYELSDEFGNLQGNASHAMFLALYYLRTGDDEAAIIWTRRSLRLAVDHGPAYMAQVINTTIAAIKSRSPADAAVLLGALRSHRSRKAQTGTQPEIEAEVRYEASLRRTLGDEFDDWYAAGAALDEAGMVALAFEQLDAAGGADA